MSYYTSRYRTGGVSYYSGIGSSSRTSYRPRFRTGWSKPDYEALWFKYRKYYQGLNSESTIDGSKVFTVDFLTTENRTAHHTEEYTNTSLIIRRGQEFNINIDVNVPFERTQHNLTLLFSKGNKPEESKGTLVRLNILNDRQTAEQKIAKNPLKWYGYFSTINSRSIGATLSIVIKPPYTALVGNYKVTTKLQADDLNGQRKRFVVEEEEPIYVLFNAWCKDDQVYLKNDAEREEYVLNDKGRIWVGHYTYSRPWNFGQFDDYCLEAAVHLLNNCTSVKAPAHGNVTLVARALSAMANSCSDNQEKGFRGVLTGNWSGDYSGGTAPSAWVGSQAILEEYMLTKREVKFGQCWVFSGLLTTLGRTLGIPTRSVTNFSSAHDTDFSLTIDDYITEDGEPMSGMGDSVWNFHVWNESWFARPDLPDGYDGWQAYDATPQEASEGVMWCGPVSVNAIKKGNVYLNYDAKFIFGEVNGDKVTWMFMLEKGEAVPVTKDTNAVGEHISTKEVTSDERLDVTEHYKFPEGSTDERQAVARATQFSSRAADFKAHDFYETATDITFVYDNVKKENGDVTVKLAMNNTSSEVRHVTLTLTAVAAYYTGVTAEDLDNKKVEIVLDPGQTKMEEWSMLAVNYFKAIDSDAKLKIYIMAKAAETKQVFVKNELFEIDKPDLSLVVSKSKVTVGETFDLTINFTNPLDMTLTQGYIMLEGPGIQKNRKIYVHRSVPAKGDLSETVQLTPKYKGKRELIASFNCREMSGIYGSIKMEVVAE